MSGSVASFQSYSSLDSRESQLLPTFTTFLRDVPPQLTILLAELGPHIALLRRIVEAASWRSEFSDSWLLLGVWWAVCLLSEFTLRYFLLAIAVAIYVYLSNRPPSTSRPPVTEQSLQAVVIDMSVLEALLPQLPHPRPLPLDIIARILAVLYIPALALSHVVRLKVLLGIFGTILLIWRARWAVNIRVILWRSAWVRRGLSRVWALLSGQPSGSVLLRASTLVQIPETTRTVRFLITVYENQRWWVGLDWTTALLPSERPPWCSASFESVPPPSTFTLPPPTVTYVGDGKGGLVKRTASWTWEEGEWKVSVRKELGLKRIEKELPAPKEDAAQQANRVGKAKQKVYDASQKLKSPRDGDSKDEENHELDDPDAAEPNSTLQDMDPEEQITDNDGWLYGDNKWKGLSSSGGLRKYTRFRKWTRIALLTEVIEPASAAEVHNHAAEQREAANLTSREKDKDENISRRSVDSSPRSSGDVDGRDPNGLRERLKSVVRKTSISI